ncbi:MAG: demethoxyubiquinone hydroxylase family protein, partial [Xanthomonadales bacterium]|nr:demethoxyubiquinone hydroxylase family protein [Xanthomonadales bacterium]
MERTYTPLDRLIAAIDQGLRLSTSETPAASRPNPAVGVEPPELDESTREHVAGLMRINHTGEICAQALYAGKAVTARSAEVKAEMEQASAEEIDHLSWCSDRLEQLDSRPSLLNP